MQQTFKPEEEKVKGCVSLKQTEVSINTHINIDT